MANAYRAPSAKSLIQRLGLDETQAALVRTIIKTSSTNSLLDIIDEAGLEKTAGWIRRCYNMPSLGELKMEAINEVIGGHGVEAVFQSVDSKWPLFTYINMGDTYNTTIVRTRGTSYSITTWGDMVESLERRGIHIY